MATAAAKQIRTDVSGFNNNLSSADDTVQKALDTIDNLSLGGGGSSVLSDITAAVAANSINSGDNAQVWNFSLSTASKIAMRYSENVASTGVGSVLFQIDTIVASTAIPLLVSSQGVEVFRITTDGDDSSPQMFYGDGEEAFPVIAPLSDKDTGITFENGIGLVFGGTIRLRVESATQVVVTTEGTATVPGLEIGDGSGTGISLVNSIMTLLVDNESIAQLSNEGSGTGELTIFGNATPAFKTRRFNGTLAVPTVIITGEEVLQLTGEAFVGATNTYQVSSQIKFGTEGTISDAGNGAPGTIEFIVHGPSGVIDALKIDSEGNLLTNGIAAPTSSKNNIVIGGGTVPTANPVAGFVMYSTSAASTESAHFRSPDGTIIKLFQSAAYTPTNVVTDRAYDANSTTLAELADIVGTIISDLQATGLLG